MKYRSLSPWLNLSVAVLVSCATTTPNEDPELVFVDSPAVWVAPLPAVRIAPDESWAAFGNGRWLRVVNLQTGHADETRFREGLDRVSAVVFLGEVGAVRQGALTGQDGWFVGETRIPELPDDAVARWSDDGKLAYYRPAEPRTITVDSKTHSIDGKVGALEWSSDGSHVLALVTGLDGGSFIVQADSSESEPEVVTRGLDAPLRGRAIGITPDGSAIYLALASDQAFDVSQRHLPGTDRDLDIYEVDLATGAKTPVVETSMDELSPRVVGEHLYWTRVNYHQTIVVLPSEGGEAHLVAEDGQLPYWRHDGRAIAYTVGLPSAADAPLNMDADVIVVDENARAVGEPRRVIEGYHEDFTPTWSPDGSWLAFHSHRSETAVPFYDSKGSTDDTYLLRAGASIDQEIRLTDFGWEAGMADWAPDGRRLVFSTWEKGTPGIGVPWIVIIDPDSGTAIEMERIDLPEPLRSARLVAWAPSGERVAIENDEGDERESIWVLDLETGAAERIVEYECDTYGGLDWTPDGKSIVYSARSDGLYQIYRVSAQGGEPIRLSQDTGQLMQPQVSPDGRFIATTRLELTRELWRIDKPSRGN